MSSTATEQLPYEQAAEFAQGQAHATEKKWSRRRSTVFVIGASTLLWTLIVLLVLEGF